MRRTPGPRLSGKDIDDFFDPYHAIHERHGYRGRDSSDALISYCKKFIDEIKAGKKGNPKSKRVTALKSNALYWLADAYVNGRNYERAHETLLTALDDAYASGYHDVLYSCLHRLGTDHLTFTNDYDKSLECLQRALVYAWTAHPVFYLTTLQFLATAYERKRQTDQALAIYDWMINIDPTDRGSSRLLKFQFLARIGRKAEVEAVAAAGAADTCESVINYIAAQRAMEADYDQESIARLGLSIAKSTGSRRWTRFFTIMLKPDDPGED